MLLSGLHHGSGGEGSPDPSRGLVRQPRPGTGLQGDHMVMSVLQGERPSGSLPQMGSCLALGTNRGSGKLEMDLNEDKRGTRTKE